MKYLSLQTAFNPWPPGKVEDSILNSPKSYERRQIISSSKETSNIWPFDELSSIQSEDKVSGENQAAQTKIQESWEWEVVVVLHRPFLDRPIEFEERALFRPLSREITYFCIWEQNENVEGPLKQSYFSIGNIFNFKMFLL